MNNVDQTKCWLVFVESNTSGSGQLFARVTVQCGYGPVLLAKDPARYSYIHQGSVDYVPCDTSSLQELQKAICQYPKLHS